MRLLICLVVSIAISTKLFAFTSFTSKIRSRPQLSMVNGLDIKPSTVASVPDIQDDEGNRNSGNMRPRAKDLGWKSVKAQLSKEFGLSDKGTYTSRKRDWHPSIFILLY
jgi:hypothetical protein